MADKVIQARMNTLKVLWGALTGAIPIYGLVLFMVSRSSERPSPENNIMPIAFGAVAVSIAVVSQLMPTRMYKEALSRKTFKLEDERFGDAAPGQYREAMDSHKVFAEPKDALEMAIVLYNPPFILGMALTESIALFGFVLGFLGHPIIVAGPFFGVALALAALRYPSVPGIIKALEQAVGARMPR